MRAVGRPPAERGVFSFEGRLVAPRDQVVLETSFVVEALIPSQPRHAECRAFLEALAAADATVAFNAILHLELWEAAFQIAIAEKHGRAKVAKAREDGRIRRRGQALRDEVAAAFENVLTTFTWTTIGLDEVTSLVPRFMGFGLKSLDAVHAATAEFVGFRGFVTMDYHFASVPEGELELWVPGHRVRPCRARRKALR